MTAEIIDQAFCAMIGKSGIHKTLGITSNHVKVLRHQVRNGKFISLDKKIRLLEKTGWEPGWKQWSDHDLVDLIRLVIRSSQAARDFGPTYILDKFKAGTR